MIFLDKIRNTIPNIENFYVVVFLPNRLNATRKNFCKNLYFSQVSTVLNLESRDIHPETTLQ